MNSSYDKMGLAPHVTFSVSHTVLFISVCLSLHSYLAGALVKLSSP